MDKKHTFITRDGTKYALGFNKNGSVELFRLEGKKNKRWVWKKTYVNVDVAAQRMLALDMAEITFEDLSEMIATFHEAWMRLSNQIERWRHE